MLQDIAPHRFDNSFRLRSAVLGDRLLIYHSGKALLKVENGQITLPILGEFPGILPEDCRSLFSVDTVWYSMPRGCDVEPPEGYAYYSVREYRSFRPMELLFPVAVGGSLSRWYHDNRFCGSCGAVLTDSQTERALICPDCGRVIYPKICPAVIVAVRNGDRLLLTRYADRPSVGYALIAGFNEIGESIEQTVHREVSEEVGIRVRNLEFYKSQPWVLTDSLLMGFYCDLDGDDRITLQESELSLGRWIPRSELPEDTQHLSLTAEMIEQFRLGNR